jgi:hypothetical protein
VEWWARDPRSEEKWGENSAISNLLNRKYLGLLRGRASSPAVNRVCR